MHIGNSNHAQKKKSSILAWTITAIFLITLILQPFSAFAQEIEEPTILIQEIAWAGSSLSIADEWIELANLSSATTTIANWSIHGAGTSDRIIFLPEDAEIPPGETYLIANYAETDEKSALETIVNVATSTISLSNSKLQIELYDENNNLIDTAGDGSLPFAGATDPIASMIRISSADGSLAENWIGAADARGFKTDMIDLGTPGYCDLCKIVGSQESEVGSQEHAPSASEESEAEEPTSEAEEATSETETVSSEQEAGGSGESEESSSEETQSTSTSETEESTESEVEESTSEEETTSTESESASEESESVSISETEGSETTNNEEKTVNNEETIEEPETVSDEEEGVDSGQWIENGEETAVENEEAEESTPEETTSTETTSVSEEETESTESETVSGEESRESVSEETESVSTSTSTSEETESVSETVSSKQEVLSSEESTESSSEETEIEESTTTSTESETVIATVTTKLTFSLNETVSNPLSGSEWIELYISSDTATSTDRELFLYDATGKIATIAKGTPLSFSHYLLVALSSAKLNNSGDELSLRENDGSIIETTTIPKLAKGECWAKDENEWKISDILTPGSTNLFPVIENEESVEESGVESQESEVEESTESASEETASESTSETETQSTEVATQNTQIDEILASAEQSNAMNQETKTKGSINSSSKTTSKTTKTSTKTSSTDLEDHPFDDMFDSSLHTARVRVIGTVASIPKLLGAAHNFVLQSEDGRGLLVYLPKHLHVPEYGSTVKVGGTLSTTYQGPELRMKTTDVWMTVTTSTPPTPRIVDLLAPSEEDAFSLVTIEGVITDVKTSSVTIETDDGIYADISIPSVLKFRTKRLVKNDRIRVIGLLNIRKDIPTIIARQAEDIEIISHAEDTIATPTVSEKKSFPDWIPFVAAGTAIAAGGAGKRVREVMRKRQLKRIMHEANRKASAPHPAS